VSLVEAKNKTAFIKAVLFSSVATDSDIHEAPKIPQSHQGRLSKEGRATA
jgi:hypothetical protein